MLAWMLEKTRSMFWKSEEAESEKLEPRYYGPATIARTPIEGGVHVKIGLWVGGAGLQNDGEWGKIVSVEFPDMAEYPAPLKTKMEMIVRNNYPALRTKYSAEAAQAISFLMVAAASGSPPTRKYTLEELRSIFA